IHRSAAGIVPMPDPQLVAREPEAALRIAAESLIDNVKGSIGSFQLSLALRDIWDLIGAPNRYIVVREPWKLAKSVSTTRGELDTALYVAADTLLIIAELIRPFMPDTATRTLGMLGVTPSATSWSELRPGTLAPGTKLGETTALFPRIDHSVEELRHMAAHANDGFDAPPQHSDAPAPEPASTSSPAQPGTGAPVHPSASVAAHSSTSAPGPISIDEFMKVELRVAKVLTAERVPKSNRLLKLLVDTGVDQRTIVAGIAEAYEPDALVGLSVAIVFNLKPAKLMGIESNGMVLAASPDGGKPVLVSFEEPPAPG